MVGSDGTAMGMPVVEGKPVPMPGRPVARALLASTIFGTYAKRVICR